MPSERGVSEVSVLGPLSQDSVQGLSKGLDKGSVLDSLLALQNSLAPTLQALQHKETSSPDPSSCSSNRHAQK